MTMGKVSSDLLSATLVVSAAAVVSSAAVVSARTLVLVSSDDGDDAEAADDGRDRCYRCRLTRC